MKVLSSDKISEIHALSDIIAQEINSERAIVKRKVFNNEAKTESIFENCVNNITYEIYNLLKKFFKEYELMSKHYIINTENDNNQPAKKTITIMSSVLGRTFSSLEDLSRFKEDTIENFYFNYKYKTVTSDYIADYIMNSCNEFIDDNESFITMAKVEFSKSK